MTTREILKAFGIFEVPEIVYEYRDHKVFEGLFDPVKNTITIYNTGDKEKTLVHELVHVILYHQGKPYRNHTRTFYYVEGQIYELLFN